MHDDWRLRVTLAGSEHAEALSARLAARELDDEVAAALGDAIAVSRDGAELFLYADTHDALRTAERLVREDLARHGWEAEVVASRWHPDEEEWEPADAPTAATAAAKEAERAALMRREDAESEAAGFPEFEARAALPTHQAARELSERLEREGVPHLRRWRYVIVGADDEDAARGWAERLRAEAPAGAEITTEGTFTYVERADPAPFKGIAALGGGVP